MGLGTNATAVPERVIRNRAHNFNFGHSTRRAQETPHLFPGRARCFKNELYASSWNANLIVEYPSRHLPPDLNEIFIYEHYRMRKNIETI